MIEAERKRIIQQEALKMKNISEEIKDVIYSPKKAKKILATIDTANKIQRNIIHLFVTPETKQNKKTLRLRNR